MADIASGHSTDGMRVQMRIRLPAPHNADVPAAPAGRAAATVISEANDKCSRSANAATISFHASAMVSLFSMPPTK